MQRLFKLSQEGRYQEAQGLQAKLAIGEAILGAGGAAAHKVGGFKVIVAGMATLTLHTHVQYLVEVFYGYGGVPRRPQQPVPEGLQKEAREVWHTLMEIEMSL